MKIKTSRQSQTGLKQSQLGENGTKMVNKSTYNDLGIENVELCTFYE